jgi:hypothetical protein
MQVKSKRAAVAGAALITTAAIGGAGILTTANAAPDASASNGDGSHHSATTAGRLHPLNNSGAVGKALVKSEGRRLHVELRAHRLAPNLPHAQHIHFGAQARHECPTVADDSNGDFRLTTSEGAPAYGPVRVSLTTKGDTSPASVLAVERFPTAPKGEVDYSRTTRTSKAVARAIRRGEAVVVVHGVDYNSNGEYDFQSAGTSDLDESLPAEATDPASCGVLHVR